MKFLLDQIKSHITHPRTVNHAVQAATTTQQNIDDGLTLGSDQTYSTPLF